VTPRVLIAGVGNVFRGDDAFGVEVARRLAGRSLLPGVRVIDFGIRGLDLAYAILDGYDVVILADATPRGGCPGTLYDLEPQPEPGAPVPAGLALDCHGVDLPAVFNFVQLMGGRLPRLRLIGCEPAALGSEDEWQMGLSEPVAAAVEPAADLVEGLVIEAIRGTGRA